MPDAPDLSALPHPNQVHPSAILKVGSFLEAETYFKSPYYQDSYYFPFNPDPNCRGNSYKIYDEMRDDDQVKVALSFKKDVVVNSGWQVDCENPLVQEAVTQSLKRMQEDGSLQMSFEDAVRDMLSSYDYGFSIAEPVFAIRDGLYSYDSIRVRPPQSFRFVVSEKGDVNEVIQSSSRGEIYLDPKMLVHHVYQTEWGNPYGKSDLRGAFMSWKAKKFVTKFLAIYLERFAGPTTVGKYPSNWDTDEVSAFTEALKRIQNATTLAVPEDSMVEFVQANKDSSQMYIHALNYYNMHIGRALLVPDLLGISGEKTGGGSFALGQDQFKLFLATLNKDRESLARKITLRIIKPLVRANWGDQVKCDFKFVAYTMDDTHDLFTLWGDMIRYGVLKPNDGEVNYIRKKLNMPEGPVVIGDSTKSITGKGPDAEGVTPRGGGPAQAAVHSFKATRPLTQAERKVDFAAVQKTLDFSEADLARRLKRAARAVWQDYLKQISKSNLVGRFDPQRLTELKPRFLKDVNVVLKHGFADLLDQAIAEAKRELFPNRKFALSDGELSYDDMMAVLDAEAFNITADYAGLVSKKVNQAIANGLKQSMSNDEIVAKIRQELPDDTDTWIDTLVRTKTTEIYNRGRKSYFDNDPVAQSVVEAYQFSAIMDGRTSEICRSLDKKVFAADDENINLLTPPLHFNCRSVIVPVTTYEKDSLDQTEAMPDLADLQDMGAGLLTRRAHVRKYTEPYGLELQLSGDNMVLAGRAQGYIINTLRIANLDTQRPVETAFRAGAGQEKFAAVLDKAGVMQYDLASQPWTIQPGDPLYVVLSACVRVHVTITFLPAFQEAS